MQHGGGRGSALPAPSVSYSRLLSPLLWQEHCRDLHGAVLSTVVTTNCMWSVNTCSVSRATCGNGNILNILGEIKCVIKRVIRQIIKINYTVSLCLLNNVASRKFKIKSVPHSIFLLSSAGVEPPSAPDSVRCWRPGRDPWRGRVGLSWGPVPGGVPVGWSRQESGHGTELRAGFEEGRRSVPVQPLHRVSATAA